MQPLLRNGGRAVVLEPLTQAERNLLYAIRTFALFRQQFFVVTMTGGQIQNFGAGFNLQGFSAPGNSDPTMGFLPVVFNLVEVEVDRRNLFFLESLAKLYQELIQGEASGLSRLQVDQVMQSLITGRQALFGDKITYRTQLDQFRMQLSLPPDTPIIVDMSLAQPFYDVFDAVDRWQRRPDRDLDELPGIIAKIPELEDIDVEGRSVLEPYRNYRSTLTEFRPENEEGLEDLLAIRRPDRSRVPHGPDEQSGPALRLLEADPVHGECSERRPQSHPQQQRLHAGYELQPVCIPQSGQAVFAHLQCRAATRASGRAEQFPYGTDQLPADPKIIADRGRQSEDSA